MEQEVLSYGLFDEVNQEVPIRLSGAGRSEVLQDDWPQR
jgi:hypothetical protein